MNFGNELTFIMRKQKVNLSTHKWEASIGLHFFQNISGNWKALFFLSHQNISNFTLENSSLFSKLQYYILNIALFDKQCFEKNVRP